VKNKIIPYRGELKTRARDLRKKSTLSEILLWNQLKRRQLGRQFHRQVPLLDYIVDFYCHELKLAIEVDGSSQDHEQAVQYDSQRQKRLELRGVHFLRVDDLDVKQHINEVMNEIAMKIEELEGGNNE
jgi:very-short-patch-repair endonuclease